MSTRRQQALQAANFTNQQNNGGNAGNNTNSCLNYPNYGGISSGHPNDHLPIENKLAYANDLKQGGTIDVRFDKRSRATVLRQEAIEQYQENCYILGQVFSNVPLSKENSKKS